MHGPLRFSTTDCSFTSAGPVQFFTKYGGCEVIAIQNLIYRKECASYCVPLLPFDLAEKAITDAVARRREATLGS